MNPAGLVRLFAQDDRRENAIPGECRDPITVENDGEKDTTEPSAHVQETPNPSNLLSPSNTTPRLRYVYVYLRLLNRIRMSFLLEYTQQQLFFVGFYFKIFVDNVKNAITYTYVIRDYTAGQTVFPPPPTHTSQSPGKKDRKKNSVNFKKPLLRANYKKIIISSDGRIVDERTKRAIKLVRFLPF